MDYQRVAIGGEKPPGWMFSIKGEKYHRDEVEAMKDDEIQKLIEVVRQHSPGLMGLNMTIISTLENILLKRCVITLQERLNRLERNFSNIDTKIRSLKRKRTEH